MPDLNADELIDRAVARSGLSWFSEAPLRGGLDAYIAAFNAHGHTARSQASTAKVLEDLLVERLRIDDWIRHHPEILEAEVNTPFVVTGMGRAGTTALAQFLAQDPQARSLRRWEAANVVPPPVAGEDDPRMVATRLAFIERDRQMPAYRSMLPVNFDDPDEHYRLLDLTFSNVSMHVLHSAPGFVPFILKSDLKPAYRYMKDVLKLLQSGTPAPHWNLKSPSDLYSVLDLKAVFPKARIIWSHRDIVKAISSNCSLLYMLRTSAGEELDKAAHGAEVLDFFDKGMTRMLAARDQMGEAEYIDIRQSELAADAVGTIEKIYDRLGMTFSDEHRQAIAAKNEARKSAGAADGHPHSPEEFGLSAGLIRERFAPYIDRFWS
jgi:hypothetical protein